ncbi:unnamed protein product, partial [Rotaria magnacalcarata]
MLLFYQNEARYFLRAFWLAWFSNSILICLDLQAPCAYFGIQTEHLKKKLISKKLEFKKEEGPEVIDQTFTVDKAIFTRDALAKSTYSRIFDHLIKVVNGIFQTSTKSDLTIGILDIYGFEIFDRNSFEQFCI